MRSIPNIRYGGDYIGSGAYAVSRSMCGILTDIRVTAKFSSCITRDGTYSWIVEQEGVFRIWSLLDS